ncbi:unnamed protein product [Linum trigynum]|uniref:Uncharacterized protein n=1 Tax=Linum trigynum TaxID=586398 RepID=A0AAV2FSP5_9ROSI
MVGGKIVKTQNTIPCQDTNTQVANIMDVGKDRTCAERKQTMVTSESQPMDIMEQGSIRKKAPDKPGDNDVECMLTKSTVLEKQVIQSETSETSELNNDQAKMANASSAMESHDQGALNLSP